MICIDSTTCMYYTSYREIARPPSAKTSILRLCLLFRNLDPLTETYGLSFYMQYLAHWPEYFQVAESPSGEIMGYSK